MPPWHLRDTSINSPISLLKRPFINSASVQSFQLFTRPIPSFFWSSYVVCFIATIKIPFTNKMVTQSPRSFAAALVALFTSIVNGLPQSVDTVGPPICDPTTVLVGDGDPHQNYLHVQATDTIDCGEAVCSVSALSSHTIGWTATIEDPFEWISGSFAVMESYTTGGTYTCQGNPGQSICVIRAVAHTAYTVQDTTGGTDCGAGSPSYVMKSPNTNDEGYVYICKTSECGSNGDQYWDTDNAPVGGPGPLAPCLGAECGP